MIVITYNRYFPEHNGAARIFHEDMNLYRTRNDGRIYILNFRPKFMDHSKVRKQGRTIVIPITLKFTVNLINLLFCISYIHYLRKRVNSVHLHLLTITWQGLLSCYITRIWFDTYTIESTLFGDIDTPRKLPFLVHKFKQWLKGFLLKKCNRIKVYSAIQKDECLSLGIENTVTIPPILHKAFYKINSRQEKDILKRKLQLNLDTHLFLFVGALSKRKGYDILAESIIAFNANYKIAKNTSFVIIGPCTSDTQLISAPNVRYVGFCDHVNKYMQACDTFVLPTRSEGFGRVYLEALGCGLFPLTTEIPGVNDYVGGVGKFLDLIANDYAEAYAQRVRKELGFDTKKIQKERQEILMNFRADALIPMLREFYA